MTDTKKEYAAPELKEWGAVAEITQVACVNGCYEGSVFDKLPA